MNFYYVSAIRSSFGDYIAADTATEAVAKFRLAWGDDTHGAISARVAVYGEDECSGIFYNDGRHDCTGQGQTMFVICTWCEKVSGDLDIQECEDCKTEKHLMDISADNLITLRAERLKRYEIVI